MLFHCTFITVQYSINNNNNNKNIVVFNEQQGYIFPVLPFSVSSAKPGQFR